MEGSAFNRKPSPREIVPMGLEDFDDAPQVKTLLSRLPAELRQQHMQNIEDLSDDEAVEYLQDIHEKREAASRELHVSDPRLQPHFTGPQSLKDLETTVFTDTENSVGAGTTARVKRLELQSVSDLPRSIAIKYLVTPGEHTLDVAQEHNLIEEVERIEKIELVEQSLVQPAKHFKVPHPYFYYRNGKTQCYGMELIDGVNLLQGIEDSYDPALRAELRERFSDLDSDTLEAEVDRFFDAMHEICLHGDIKPANLMASRDGHIYVIDFGQSKLATSVEEKKAEAFEHMKDVEKLNAKSSIRRFLNALYKEDTGIPLAEAA